MDLTPRRFEDTVVLAPTGRIDQPRSGAFGDALQLPMGRCAAGQDRVVLDLSGVEYISSAGLRVLILARKQAQAQGGTLVVAALGAMLREIFEISRFSTIFDAYPTVRDALVAISPAAAAAFDRA